MPAPGGSGAGGQEFTASAPCMQPVLYIVMDTMNKNMMEPNRVIVWMKDLTDAQSIMNERKRNNWTNSKEIRNNDSIMESRRNQENKKIHKRG